MDVKMLNDVFILVQLVSAKLKIFSISRHSLFIRQSKILRSKYPRSILCHY